MSVHSARAIAVSFTLVLAAMAAAPRAGASAVPLLAAAGTSQAPPPGLVYVANESGNSVTVYAPGANGNASPIATIAGPATGLNEPTGLAVDAAGDLFVSNRMGGSTTPPAGSVTEYAPGANGNTTPIVTIEGADTQLDNPVAVALDSSGDLFVANDGPMITVTDYIHGSSGDASPVTMLSLYPEGVDDISGVSLDSHDDLFVAATSEVDEFAPGARGMAAPTATIMGDNTGLGEQAGLTLDPAGDIWVVTSASDKDVSEFAAGANGNPTPLATITGTNTGLDDPRGLALDSDGDLYVTNEESNSVTEYGPGANGNATPIATIAGTDTGLNSPHAVAIGPDIPATLAFVTQPAGFVAGSPLTAQPTVAVEDAYGHVVTTDTSPVTLSITPGTGASGATLACDANPAAATAGVAAFAGCAVSEHGAKYTLHATDGSLTAANSAPFSLSAAPFAHVRWSPDPIAPPASLAFGRQLQLTATAVDSSGHPVPWAMVYVSLTRGTSRLDNATASCGGTRLPAYCQADANGVVRVTYDDSTKDPSGGTDVLLAGSGPVGTAQNADSYDYAGTGPVTHFRWSPDPIAAAGSLRPKSSATATLTALNAKGDPVPHAAVYLTTKLAPRSTGAFRLPGCVAVTFPQDEWKCATGPTGTVAVGYATPATPPAGGTDVIGAAVTSLAPIPAAAWDGYTFNDAFDDVHWSSDPIAIAGSLKALKRVDLTVTALDAAAKPVPGALVYMSLKTAPHPNQAQAQCSGHALPGYCQADSKGAVSITYQIGAHPPDGGTDVLAAGPGPFATWRATDTYTYAGSGPVTGFSWSLSPIAAPGTLLSHQHVSFDLTALNGAGDPVAGATLFLRTSLAPGSTGSFSTSFTSRGTTYHPCGVVSGHAGLLKCIADAQGRVPVTYIAPAIAPTAGADAIGASTSSALPASFADWDAYTFPTAIASARWSPVPIAPAASLSSPATRVNLTVTALDAAGDPVPGALLYLSSGTTGRSLNVNAACGTTRLPAYCTADSTGAVKVTYSVDTKEATSQTDTLAAGPAPGGTWEATDTYTYAGTGPVTSFSWSSSSLAPAGTLPPDHSATVTLTVTNAHGAPVPGARFFLITSQAPGSSATFSSTVTSGGHTSQPCGALSGHPGVLVCVADRKGGAIIVYKTSGNPPPGGTDAIGAVVSDVGPGTPANPATWVAYTY